MAVAPPSPFWQAERMPCQTRTCPTASPAARLSPLWLSAAHRRGLVWCSVQGFLSWRAATHTSTVWRSTAAQCDRSPLADSSRGLSVLATLAFHRRSCCPKSNTATRPRPFRLL